MTSETETRIRAAFDRHFAKSELKLLGRWTNTIFEADSAWIIRLPSNEFNTVCFNRETRLLRALSESPVCAIPRSPMLDAETSFMAYKKLPGQTAVEDQFDSVLPEQKKQLAKAIGKFLAWLHGHPVSLIPYDNASYGQDIIQHIRERAKLFGVEVANFGRQALADFDRVRSKLSNAVPLHQDLQPSNCLFDADYRLVSVIDFSLTWPGDPHWDFRRLYRFGVEAARDAAAAYEEQGGQKIDLEVVEVLERVALLNSIIWQQPSTPSLKKYLAEMCERANVASQ